MAGITKSTDTAQEYQFQTHYSKLLLEQIRKNFVLPDFAVKSPLPGKAGARSMRMFRFATPSTSDIQTVTEGTIPATSTHKQLTLEYVEVTLAQYLQTISITDKLDATGLISMMDHATEQNGLDAALHFDTLIRNELKVHTGTSGNVDYSTQNFIYAQAATNYAGVYNSGTASGSYVITSTDVLDGVTALKKNNAPKIGGYYILATAPDITRDLMKGVSGDTAWLDAAKYSNTTALYNGEVGRIWGARVVETTNPFRAAATQGTFSASGGVFSSFLFGKGAFGVSDLATMGSPNAPKIYIVKGADKSDPGNLIAAMVSFKTYFAAKLVQPLWLTQIYSQSGYGA